MEGTQSFDNKLASRFGLAPSLPLEDGAALRSTEQIDGSRLVHSSHDPASRSVSFKDKTEKRYRPTGETVPETEEYHEGGNFSGGDRGINGSRASFTNRALPNSGGFEHMLTEAEILEHQRSSALAQATYEVHAVFSLVHPHWTHIRTCPSHEFFKQECAPYLLPG
jgi:hypothetical protein